MSPKLVVANWKMNMNPTQAVKYLGHLDKVVEASKAAEVVICPPAVDLYPMSEVINKSKFSLGSQDINEADEGPRTGEISGLQLAGLADYAIVGHSERRALAGERDKQIAAKVAAALRHDITPILCVGDKLIDKEHGHAARVVSDQLTVDLSQITADDLDDLVIAYEPVWAISKGDGKGEHATPDTVEPMIRVIRETVEALFGEGAGARVRVLYGGSVNPDDVGAYVKLDDVDGVLVGGASLVWEQFARIIKVCQDAGK